MALALSRHPGESVILILEDGRTIDVHVHRVNSHGHVTLAFTAPKTITILRREVYEAASAGVEYDETIGRDYA